MQKVQESVEPTIIEKTEIPFKVPEVPITEVPKVSADKTIDESINEKLSKIMPEVISKIK